MLTDILLGMVYGGCIALMLFSIILDNTFENRAIEMGYAQYNSTNGDLYYLDKDVRYLIYGSEE